jgi:hypothetical protein
MPGPRPLGPLIQESSPGPLLFGDLAQLSSYDDAVLRGRSYGVAMRANA